MLKDTTICNVLLGINVVFIILAIKGIFFEASDKEEKYKEGILLENEDGKLLITKDTLVSIVNSVVSGFDSVKSQQTKILFDKDNNLSIILTIEVYEKSIIKELSNNIQIRVKDTIKKSLDIEVKSLDIRVKDMVRPEETKEVYASAGSTTENMPSSFSRKEADLANAGKSSSAVCRATIRLFSGHFSESTK